MRDIIVGARIDHKETAVKIIVEPKR